MLEVQSMMTLDRIYSITGTLTPRAPFDFTKTLGFLYGEYDEVAARIRAIRGIGEWSSYFILLRGLGRMERVSAFDRELGKAASSIYNNGQPLTTAEMQNLLDRYGTTQGYWAFYMRNATPERAAAMEMI
jgi:3-methyladenine DNA glycosylase/8-oxoguanine DNA glycosylase